MAEKKAKKSMLMITMILILEAIIVIAFISPGWIEEQIDKEHEATQAWLGEEKAVEIKTGAFVFYKTYFLDTDFQKAMYQLFIPTQKQKERSVGMETTGDVFFDWLKERFDAIWFSIYQTTYRVLMIFSWLPFFIPIIIATVIDGLMTRECKKREYGYTSDVRYNMSFKSIYLMMVIFLIYIFTPIQITPMIVPMCLGVIAFSVWILSSHIQQQI
ncbi:MAG: DUF4400 domain-containing protein [Methylococcales bacterium]|jgi:hypothetical protein|nr:DUF4400 domain-containing protein [Methylococcales bacterium]